MKFPAWRLLSIPLGSLLLQLSSSPAFACAADEVDTAIGCIPTDLGEATGFLFGIAVEIISLLALIMFAVGGYRAMTSGDDPERLQDAKAQMTAAVAGLFFLLFFVKIITIIGITILGITPLCHVLGTC